MSDRNALPSDGSCRARRWRVRRSNAACTAAVPGHPALLAERDFSCAGRSVRCRAAASVFAADRCRRLCQRSPQRFRPCPAGVLTPPYPDGRERGFREPAGNLPRNTAYVDHHHALCPLAPLGFYDSADPFFAGAKLPSKNDSLPVLAGVSTRSETPARPSAKRLAPPNPATVASRSKDADTSPASPAILRRSAESRKSLPAPDGSRSTGGRPCDFCAIYGVKAKLVNCSDSSSLSGHLLSPWALTRKVVRDRIGQWIFDHQDLGI